MLSLYFLNAFRNDFGRLEGNHTDDSAVIEAATNAVIASASNGIENLLIRTDSYFLYSSYVFWMTSKIWKFRGYREEDGSDIECRNEFENLDLMIAAVDIKVTIEHIDASKNDELINEADRLAKLGAKGPLVKAASEKQYNCAEGTLETIKAA